MTKFQKTQRILSIIPFFSSFFVFIVTMIELKRKKASLRFWIVFAVIFFLSGFFVYLLDSVIMAEMHFVLKTLASGILLAAANILCVELQAKCGQTNDVCKQSPSRTTIIICISAGVFLLGIVATVVLSFSFTSGIPDTNGEQDTRLASLTMGDLLSDTDSFSAFGSRYSFSGSKSNVDENLQKVDRDVCEYQFRKISGIKTLQATKVDSDTLTIEIDSTLSAGNAEIVILIDGEYYTHVVLNQIDAIVIHQVSNKLVKVQMGAESAELSVTVSRS